MKLLKDILYKTSLVDVKGTTDRPIEELTFDSRNIKAGSLFIAVRGTQVDGHKFIEQAIAKGAVAVVCEEFPAEISQEATYVQVKDSSIALGIIAQNFFDDPSTKL